MGTTAYLTGRDSKKEGTPPGYLHIPMTCNPCRLLWLAMGYTFPVHLWLAEFRCVLVGAKHTDHTPSTHQHRAKGKEGEAKPLYIRALQLWSRNDQHLLHAPHSSTLLGTQGEGDTRSLHLSINLHSIYHFPHSDSLPIS